MKIVFVFVFDWIMKCVCVSGCGSVFMFSDFLNVVVCGVVDQVLFWLIRVGDFWCFVCGFYDFLKIYLKFGVLVFLFDNVVRVFVCEIGLNL